MSNHFNCIYMYINKVNGKRYVGKAKDFNKRHNQHLRGYTWKFEEENIKEGEVI